MPVLLNDTKLVQEDKENTDWTDKTDGEQENREESSLQGSPVGKLITHNLLWHIPSQEQTGDERPQRHEQLGSKVVTIAQEILAEEVSKTNSVHKGKNVANGTQTRGFPSSFSGA